MSIVIWSVRIIVLSYMVVFAAIELIIMQDSDMNVIVTTRDVEKFSAAVMIVATVAYLIAVGMQWLASWLAGSKLSKHFRRYINRVLL